MKSKHPQNELMVIWCRLKNNKYIISLSKLTMILDLKTGQASTTQHPFERKIEILPVLSPDHIVQHKVDRPNHIYGKDCCSKTQK